MDVGLAKSGFQVEDAEPPRKKIKLDGDSPQQQQHSHDAVNKVLGVTELLETILILVDRQTLLPAQRVSKDWCQTIKASTTLQKKLFYAPVASFAEAQKLGIVENKDLLCYTRSAHGTGIEHVSLINSLIIKQSHWGSEINMDGSVELLDSMRMSEKTGASVKRSWEDMRLCHWPQKRWVRSFEQFDRTGSEPFYGTIHAQTTTIGDIMVQVEGKMMEQKGRLLPWNRCEIWMRDFIIRYGDWLAGLAGLHLKQTRK